MSYLAASQALYAAQLEPRFGPAVGCAPATIEQLERGLGAPLPAAYREFLTWIGEHRDGPFVGSDCFPEHLARNNESMPELFAENGLAFPLPDRYCAFFLHQGYIAVWFALPATSDDPPVWIHNEASTPEPEQRPHFSTWLWECLQDIAAEQECSHS